MEEFSQVRPGATGPQTSSPALGALQRLLGGFAGLRGGGAGFRV